jgi:hypothetical protein
MGLNDVRDVGDCKSFDSCDNDPDRYIVLCDHMLVEQTDDGEFWELNSDKSQNRRLPSDWFEEGPRGGIYFIRTGTKCHPPSDSEIPR